MHHASFCNFRNIKVAEFNCAISGKEQICSLDVSMAYFQVMQSFEPVHNLNKVMPKVFFWDISIPLLMLINQLE